MHAVYIHIIYTHNSCQSTNLFFHKLTFAGEWELSTLRNASCSPSWVDQKDEAPAGIFLAPSSKKIVFVLHCQQLVSLASLPENTADNISLNL